MQWNGYAGAGLWVDLSTGAIRKEPLDPELPERFLGGWGITNKLANDLTKPGVDPLSPENVVVIGSGALSGTLAPASTRVMATTKLPVNGAIGTPFGGGFSHRLKAAGYDYVVITGRADRPVYLKIMDDVATLEDAGEVWGRDTVETTDHLSAKHGADSSVIAIGQAGENLVRISLAMVDKFGTLGRGGLGAVFGSKKLKAVVTAGTKGVGVADMGGFTEAARAVREDMMRYPFRSEWLKLGPAVGWLVFGKMTLSHRNWAEHLEGAQRPSVVIKALLKRVRSGHACPACPLNCKTLLSCQGEDQAGRNSSDVIWWIDRYEGCDLDRSIEYMDRCNRYGLDAVAARNLIDYAIDLNRMGILTREGADGEELDWDAQTVDRLLEKIRERQGLGGILADGLASAATRFGREAAERAVAIKSLGPFFDSRGHFCGWELSACLNPRGSYVAPGTTVTFSPGKTSEQVARYCRKLRIPDRAIDRICRGEADFDLARLIKWSEDWYSVYSCLGVCVRQPVMLSYTPEAAARLYTAATGIEITSEELHQAGERAWNLVKAANVREGFDRKDDKFPDRFFEPLKAGDKEIRLMNYNRTKELTRDDVERMFDDYYDERGWDIAKGIPTRAKLEELDLEDVADELEEGGFL